MGPNRISSMISSTIMAAFIFMMAGFEAYPQSHAGAADSGSQIQENTKNAVFMMRKLASAEMMYQERSENSEFGTTIELYNHGLIDAELMAALGCPQMASSEGKTCPGIHTPYLGYLYRLEITNSGSSGTAKFRVVGIPSVADGEMQTGAYTYYVDQTNVIRASDDPTIEAGSQSPPLGAPWAPASCEWRNNM